jgi:hypothetical protein
VDHEPRAETRARIRAARRAISPGEVRRRRLGPPGPGRRHAILGHHLEAPRRVCALSVSSEPVQRRRRHAVLKKLSAARKRNHLRLGFYYFQALDWHEPNGAGNNWDFGPDDKKDFDQYLRAKAEPQVRELLSGYGPVCRMWFDTPERLATKGSRGIRSCKL